MLKLAVKQSAFNTAIVHQQITIMQVTVWNTHDNLQQP